MVAVSDERTVERIAELYDPGRTVAAIARRLNEEYVPTPRGGHLHSHGLKRVLSWVRAMNNTQDAGVKVSGGRAFQTCKLDAMSNLLRDVVESDLPVFFE